MKKNIVLILALLLLNLYSFCQNEDLKLELANQVQIFCKKNPDISKILNMSTVYFQKINSSMPFFLESKKIKAKDTISKRLFYDNDIESFSKNVIYSEKKIDSLVKEFQEKFYTHITRYENFLKKENLSLTDSTIESKYKDVFLRKPENADLLKSDLNFNLIISVYNYYKVEDYYYCPVYFSKPISDGLLVGFVFYKNGGKFILKNIMM